MFHKLEHLSDLPNFLAFMPHADAAPGTCIPQREEAISLRHTGQSLERIERDTDRDKFMSAREAQEYGIVDHVLERLPASLVPPKPAL